MPWALTARLTVIGGGLTQVDGAVRLLWIRPTLAPEVSRYRRGERRIFGHAQLNRSGSGGGSRLPGAVHIIVLVGWCLAQVFFNALLAAQSAVLPDQVPGSQRGVASGI